jgi:hypothetical protein
LFNTKVLPETQDDDRALARRQSVDRVGRAGNRVQHLRQHPRRTGRLTGGYRPSRGPVDNRDNETGRSHVRATFDATDEFRGDAGPFVSEADVIGLYRPDVAAASKATACDPGSGPTRIDD